jgi:transposase
MNSYDRIYTLLTEDARLDKKLASAKRKGKSTTATKEAHRMGKLAAGSMAAGNPGLAKRQKEEGKAAKRGALKRTSPSTVYGGK